MHLCSEESFELRKLCTEARRAEFWLGEGFVQTCSKSHRKVPAYIYLVDALRRHCMYKVVA